MQQIMTLMVRVGQEDLVTGRMGILTGEGEVGEEYITGSSSMDIRLCAGHGHPRGNDLGSPSAHSYSTNTPRFFSQKLIIPLSLSPLTTASPAQQHANFGISVHSSGIWIISPVFLAVPSHCPFSRFRVPTCFLGLLLGSR